MNVKFATPILLFGVLTTGQSMAAKPTPPPPPPPPVTSCPGVFPAYAFTRDVTNVKGNRTIVVSTDLLVANETGECFIKIANSSNGIGVQGYRQNGANGRIIFDTNSGLGMVNITASGGSVTSATPILPVYNNVAYHTVALSKDANTIYLIDEVRDVNGNWVDTLKSVNIASCSSNCSAEAILFFGVNFSANYLAVNDADDRLYFGHHAKATNVQTISMIQKSAGVWGTSMRQVVSNQDLNYPTDGGFETNAYGHWGDAEVLAITVLRSVGSEVQVLDITNCGPVGETSCLAAGEATVEASAISGHGYLFGMRGASLLFVKDYSYSSRFDLVSLTSSPLLQCRNIRSGE